MRSAQVENNKRQSPEGVAIFLLRGQVPSDLRETERERDVDREM
jgi:hypothetical protein